MKFTLNQIETSLKESIAYIEELETRITYYDYEPSPQEAKHHLERIKEILNEINYLIDPHAITTPPIVSNKSASLVRNISHARREEEND